MKRILLVVPLLAPFAAGCTDANVTSPSSTPPPPWGVPITGGTMTVSHDGSLAVISDPDRDRVLFVNLATQHVVETKLVPDDEPGRVVEDADAHFHVALRRGGALVDFDSQGNILARRAVCAEPRGVAFDPTADVLHVACTSGELVTFPAAGGAATRRLLLARDLRDVIVQPTGLLVTRFRTAEVLQLDAIGNVVATVSPPDVARVDDDGNPLSATAAIAWRTIAMPNGTIVMTHQRQVPIALHTSPGGYGGGCGGPVESAVAVMVPGSPMYAAQPIAFDALPVDIAASNDGTQLALVTAGDQSVILAPSFALSGSDMGGCFGPGGVGGVISPPADGGGTGVGTPVPDPVASAGTVVDDQLGFPTSVAFDPAGDMLVYYPEVPAVVTHATTGAITTLVLPGGLGYDSGRELFHTETQSGLACASCHPEGRDDGLTWNFAEEGLRRTQSVAGHIMERAPYHWAGDLPDLPTLMTEVFTGRMAGNPVTHSQDVSFGPWLERVQAPAPAPVTDAAAVARGQALFDSPALGCTGCHSGPLMTTKALVNVGTGGVFKVPSLIGVGARAPYLHDGCAPALADRFGSCGGGDQHGHTSQLAAQDISDVVAYLETL